MTALSWPSDGKIAKLHGIDPDKKYLLLNEDSQMTETISGEVLKGGYSIRLTDTPGSLLIIYKKAP
jgi:hypothetical protein